MAAERGSRNRCMRNTLDPEWNLNLIEDSGSKITLHVITEKPYRHITDCCMTTGMDNSFQPIKAFLYPLLGHNDGIKVFDRKTEAGFIEPSILIVDLGMLPDLFLGNA